MREWCVFADGEQAPALPLGSLPNGQYTLFISRLNEKNSGLDRMGKKKKAAEPTPEELDVEKYRLTADLAVADAEDLRRQAEWQHERLQQLEEVALGQTAETEEVYQYLDAQMLAQGRDRLANEAELRQVKMDAQKDHNDLQRQLDDLQRESSRTIELLRADLQSKEEELQAVQEFRGVRPRMESELADLKRSVQQEQEARKRDEHALHVEMWQQREALNAQMLERIQQAKAKFLEITSQMLDSTVHRTMLENQHMTEELQMQSDAMEQLIRENTDLTAERTALKMQIRMQREQEVAEVRRSLARRKLAQTATQQHDALSDELRRARADLKLARERSAAHEQTIERLGSQLSTAQRRVGALMQKVGRQQAFIQERIGSIGHPTPIPPTPNWSLILGDDRFNEGEARGGSGASQTLHVVGGAGDEGGGGGQGGRRGGGDSRDIDAVPIGKAVTKAHGGCSGFGVAPFMTEPTPPKLPLPPATGTASSSVGAAQPKRPSRPGSARPGSARAHAPATSAEEQPPPPPPPPVPPLPAAAAPAPASAASAADVASADAHDGERKPGSAAMCAVRLNDEDVRPGGGGERGSVSARERRPQTAAALGSSPRAIAGNRAVSAARSSAARNATGGGAYSARAASGGGGPGTMTDRTLAAIAPGGPVANGYATDRDLLSAALIDHMQRTAGYALTQRNSSFNGRPVTSVGRPGSSSSSPRGTRPQLTTIGSVAGGGGGSGGGGSSRGGGGSGVSAGGAEGIVVHGGQVGTSLLSIKKAAIVEQMSISPTRASPSKQRQLQLQSSAQPPSAQPPAAAQPPALAPAAAPAPAQSPS